MTNVLVFTVSVVAREDVGEGMAGINRIADEIKSNLESLGYIESATVTFGERRPQEEDQ